MILTIVYTLLLSSSVIFILYFSGLRYGLNLSDEGYLWHGSREVLKGKIPIRDFRAYDIGRYYWCALWMILLNRELLALRICLFITRIIGLFLATFMLYLITATWVVVILSAFLFAFWMGPRHKQIDIFTSIWVTFLAVILILEPHPLYYFLLGICVGFIFLIGLNHVLYAIAGIFTLLSMMGLHGYGLEYGNSLSLFVGGGIVSAVLIFSLFILIPRFLNVYWDVKVMRVLKRKTTNLSLPFPWIWTTYTPQLNGFTSIKTIFIKGMFTFMPLFYIGILLFYTVLHQPSVPKEWAIIATSSIGLFYFHHVISRADLGHLTQASFPFLITIVLLLDTFSFGYIVLCCITILSYRYIYASQQNSIPKVWSKNKNLTSLTIQHNSVWINKGQANIISTLNTFIQTHSKKEDSVLILPTLVTLYPLLERKPAVYDIFCVYPALKEEEERMIREVNTSKAPIAIIRNSPLDGKESLRFSHTHPLLWNYLNEHYQIYDTKGKLPPDIYLFIKTWL